MTRLIVLIGFLLAFCAGLAVGLTRPVTAAPVIEAPGGRPEGGRRGWLAQQLELSPLQQEQLDEIWSETARRGRHEQFERRRRLRRERDEAIAALIRDEDRPAYEAILREHDERAAELEAEWRESFRAAVERTRALLTPEQREKYQALMDRQGWGGGEDRGRSTTRPAGETARPSRRQG